MPARPSRNTRRIVATAASVFAFAAWIPAAGAVEPLCPTDVRELWLTSVLNEVDQRVTVLVLQHRSGRYLVRQLDLRELRLPVPNAEPVRYRNELYYPISALPKLGFLVEQERRTLSIQWPAAAWQGRRQPQGTLDPDTIREQRLPVVLSGWHSPFTVRLLVDGDARHYVRHSELLELGLPLPAGRPLRYWQQDVYPVDEMPALRFESDGRLLRIDIRPLTADCAAPTPRPHPPAAKPRPAAPTAPTAPATPTVRSAPAAPLELFLSMSLNGQPPRTVDLALQLPDGEVALPARALQALRLRQSAGGAVAHAGETYYRLRRLTGVDYRLDVQGSTLAVTAAADAMQPVALTAGGRSASMPQTPPPGAFLNYDVFTERLRAADTTASSTGGLFELGMFGRYGAATTTAIAIEDEDAAEAVRLESGWRYDWPEHMTTLAIGDALGHPGSWGNAVRFGGIKWGTNFATQPGFITFPLPTLAGESAVPTTVDVYVNNVRRLHQDVPGGPFSIEEIPVVTGSGEIRMVTRDLLGREQVIVQPFYASSDLLRQGLHQYNYELGSIREHYGQESFDYGEPFAAATHRYGVTDWFTGEVRSELTGDWQNLGLAGSLLWPRVGTLNLAVSGSRDRDAGQGLLTELGIERRGRVFSVGGRLRLVDAAFRQLGRPAEDAVAERTAQLFASVRFGRAGALSLSYLEQQWDDEDPLRLVNAGYSLSLGRLGSLSFAALVPLDEEDSPLFSTSLVVPLGTRTSASASVSQRDDDVRGRLTWQRNPPTDRGLGVRLVSELGERPGQEAQATARASFGTYQASIAAYDDVSYQLGARGSVALTSGRLLLSNWLHDSFAVVHLPGLGGIPVYRDNLPVARTDADGWALVPGLRAYEPNRIRIDQRDLPLTVNLPSTLSSTVVPYYRSGLEIAYRVENERSAMVRIVLENGSELPAGAVVRTEAGQTEHPVGLDGAAYVTGLAERTRLTAHWGNRSCGFEVVYPNTDDPLPELGPVICRDTR